MLRLGNEINRVGRRKANTPLEAPPLLHREGQVRFPSDIMAGASPAYHVQKLLGHTFLKHWAVM